MKYKILQHDNAMEMETEVQAFLDDGWQIMVIMVSHNGFLHQAIYKT